MIIVSPYNHDNDDSHNSLHVAVPNSIILSPLSFCFNSTVYAEQGRILKNKKGKKNKKSKKPKSNKISVTESPTVGGPCAEATTQKAVLLALKADFANPAAVSNWDSTTDPCDADASSWTGITCASGEVTIINLRK